MRAHGLNPRIKKSPFFDATVRSGANEFHPYNSMWMPVGYDTPINEYWNVVERASVWDVSVQRIVEISGPDAQAFMSLLTPRNISKVRVGQCRYVFLTNQDGGILNDPVMLRIEEDRYWLSTADSDVYLWAKGVAVFAGMNVNITTPDVFPMQVQGPVSPKVVSHMFGDDILDLPYYSWMWGEFEGRRYVISRTGYSSEVGFELYFHGRDGGEAVWERILELGKPFGLSPGSPNRIRRIEGGVLDFGSDILTDNNPYEMGLGRMVDLTKSDFIGKAALEKVAASGPSRQMMGAFMDGTPFEKNNEHRWSILEGETKVGEITAAVYSPRLEKNIGFALMQADKVIVDAGYSVDTPEGRRGLTLTTTPFWDPEKKIPRAKLR